MSKNKPRDQADPETASFRQAAKKNELKGQNPNEGHNAKKASLGPNTNR
jgi:hypothetical protein